MVTDEDAVEIHAPILLRGFILAIAVIGTFGVLLRFFFAPYEKLGDIVVQYFVLFVNFPLLWWVGIFNWKIGGEYVYRADATGMKTGYDYSKWYLPFWKVDLKRKVVAWNQIAAIEWLPSTKSKHLIPVLKTADDEIILSLHLLLGRPEREQFLSFIQAKIDANRS